MMDYLLLDSRAQSLDFDGYEEADPLMAFEAFNDEAAIREAQETFDGQGWALFRKAAKVFCFHTDVQVACANESGVYWRGGAS